MDNIQAAGGSKSTTRQTSFMEPYIIVILAWTNCSLLIIKSSYAMLFNFVIIVRVGTLVRGRGGITYSIQALGGMSMRPGFKTPSSSRLCSFRHTAAFAETTLSLRVSSAVRKKGLLHWNFKKIYIGCFSLVATNFCCCSTCACSWLAVRDVLVKQRGGEGRGGGQLRHTRILATNFRTYAYLFRACLDELEIVINWVKN